MQGVELTDIKHYDAGFVKIFAGEPGHVLTQKHFGYYGGAFTEGNDAWSEIDRFDPIQYLSAQSKEKLNIYFQNVTWPIVTWDYDASKNYQYDGVIEPLTIRERVTFSGIDFPHSSHDTRGLLLDGNSNFNDGSDRILSINEFNSTQNINAFEDFSDVIGNFTIQSFINMYEKPIKPFEEISIYSGIPNSITNTEIRSNFTGSFESHDILVNYNEISATAGFIYGDVQGVGTDSIAFGGLTY
jgi:hypothetical protein